MAKYNKQTVEKICEYIRDGDSQKLACKKAGIGDSTFHDWIKAKPEFSESIKKAKEEFQATIAGKLEATLWKRAMGYEVTETETEYVSDVDGNPKIKSQKSKVKHIQPDTGALIFALTNVSPDKWKNRQRVETVDAKDIEKDEPRYNFDEVPRELLFKIADELQKGEHERLKQMSVKVLDVKTDEKKGKKTGNSNE